MGRRVRPVFSSRGQGVARGGQGVAHCLANLGQACGEDHRGFDVSS
jgi:hypothetical protein